MYVPTLSKIFRPASRNRIFYLALTWKYIEVYEILDVVEVSFVHGCTLVEYYHNFFISITDMFMTFHIFSH